MVSIVVLIVASSFIIEELRPLLFGAESFHILLEGQSAVFQ
jgi:hypothetical protein